MTTHYRHRQFGWVTLGALVPGALAALVLLPFAGAPAGVAIAVVAVLLAGLLFATLTVEVDDRELRVLFTGGIVRMAIPLSSIRDCRTVRNPWYYGWGIHRYPAASRRGPSQDPGASLRGLSRTTPGSSRSGAVTGGWIWNVSGRHAVELALEDGRMYRIGSDEPDALARAIASRAPSATTGPGAALAGPPRGPASGLAALAAMLLGVAAIVGLLFVLFSAQMRDPVVTATRDSLSIETPFYGGTWRLDDVTAVSLEQRMPTVLRRTNGFAASGVLRGWFDVSGLGRGKLYVDLATPPFVLVRLRGGFAIVNFADPARTAALYEQLRRLREPSPTPATIPE